MSEVNIDIAKIAETEIAKNTVNWIYRIIGAPIEDGIGLLFADALKEKRFRNAIKLKAETLKLKIDNQRQIPLSFGYKLLEKATLEDNESMIKKWANLLSNSLDSDYLGEIRKIFIDILDSLEPIDAFILEELSKENGPVNPITLIKNTKREIIMVSLDALKSLNLIVEDYDEQNVPKVNFSPTIWDDPPSIYVRGHNNCKYYLTDLGSVFINSVKRLEDNGPKR